MFIVPTRSTARAQSFPSAPHELAKGHQARVRPPGIPVGKVSQPTQVGVTVNAHLLLATSTPQNAARTTHRHTASSANGLVIGAAVVFIKQPNAPAAGTSRNKAKHKTVADSYMTILPNHPSSSATIERNKQK